MINPLKILKDPDLHTIVIDLLNFGYSAFDVSEETVHSVMTILSSYEKEPEVAARVVCKEVIRGTEPGRLFAAGYAEYKRNRKPDLLLNIIGPYIDGPVVIDVGAGDCAFAAHLLKYTERVKQIIATDILFRGSRILDDRIEFRLHSKCNPTIIPAKPNSADTVLLINTLHHSPTREVPALLSHVCACLRDAGSVVALEDTYSMSNAPVYDMPALLPRFMALRDDDKMQIFRFMD